MMMMIRIIYEDRRPIFLVRTAGPRVMFLYCLKPGWEESSSAAVFDNIGRSAWSKQKSSSRTRWRRRPFLAVLSHLKTLDLPDYDPIISRIKF